MKQLLIFLIITLNSLNLLQAQDWKQYPYHQPGTYIYFPQDEGVHAQESSEWWYLMGHVTGATSGNDYSFMLTYFHYPYAGFDGFRIFNMANETDNVFYPQTLPVMYDILAADSLNILCDPVGASPETWIVQTNPDGTAKPFQYNVSASQQNGSINLSLDTYKRPLVVGDSGYFYQGGNGNYTYYYSQTGVNISGTLTFEGTTESIAGTGWIDRQYGTFNPSTGEAYEWFSVQLDNGIDINFWNIFTTDNQIPDMSTYRMSSFYLDDTSDTASENFELTRLKYAYTADSSACYAQQWHFVWNDVDLIITTLDQNRIVELPFQFYEGATTITGTVGNTDVTGIGFAELLHSYENPELRFLNPDTVGVWKGEGETLLWQVLNPDDGNPLYYSLDYSPDDGATWQEIVSGINDTSYYWDFSFLDDGTVCLFRLTGSSVDGTLSNTIISDAVTLHIISGINDLVNEKSAVVYPNPSQGIFYFNLKNVRKILLMDIYGNTILQNNVQPNKTGGMNFIDLSDHQPGIYLLKLSNDKSDKTYKLILQNH